MEAATTLRRRGTHRGRLGCAAKSRLMPTVSDHLFEQIKGMAGELGDCIVLALQSECCSIIARGSFVSRWDRLADTLPTALMTVLFQQLLGPGISNSQRRELLVYLINVAEGENLDPTDCTPELEPAVKPRQYDGYFTTRTTARILRVSQTHLDTLIDEGKLPGFMTTPSGRRLIPRAAIEAYLDQAGTAQSDSLNRMVEVSDGSGLRDLELEGLPARRKSLDETK